MLEIKEIISDDAEIEYKENTLTVEDFQELRTAVGWFKAHPVLAERSVNGTLYSVCAYAVLMASKGKEAFYERYGFISRPNEKQGAGMQQRICIGYDPED